MVDFGQIMEGALVRALSLENFTFLDALITEKEVIKVLKDMGTTKAPSLDSFHALFYQKYWQIIKSEVLEVVLRFKNVQLEIRALDDIFVLPIPKV